MSTKHMTLLLWYGETAGVKVNRRYDIDSGDKFKDFFGARRTIEEGVWKQTDEKVLVGSKAYDRMSADARQLILKSDNVILPSHAGWPSSPTKRKGLKRGAFALNYHNEASIDIESMDFQPIEERVAAMLATGHTGTLKGRWTGNQVNVQQLKKSKGNCSKCTAGICTQRCVK